MHWLERADGDNGCGLGGPRQGYKAVDVEVDLQHRGDLVECGIDSTAWSTPPPVAPRRASQVPPLFRQTQEAVTYPPDIRPSALIAPSSLPLSICAKGRAVSGPVVSPPWIS
jgi:hypothetical protein